MKAVGAAEAAVGVDKASNRSTIFLTALLGFGATMMRRGAVAGALRATICANVRGSVAFFCSSTGASTGATAMWAALSTGTEAVAVARGVVTGEAAADDAQLSKPTVPVSSSSASLSASELAADEPESSDESSSWAANSGRGTTNRRGTASGCSAAADLSTAGLSATCCSSVVGNMLATLGLQASCCFSTAGPHTMSRSARKKRRSALASGAKTAKSAAATHAPAISESEEKEMVEDILDLIVWRG